MCLNQSLKITALQRKQQGFLMPLAAFILVVLGALALTITRLSSESGLSIVQEGVSTQALYAADGGAQLGMNNLFYDTSGVLARSAIDGRCAAMTLNQDFSGNGTGLNQCNAIVSCSCIYRDGSTCNAAVAGNYDGSNAVFESFYQVTSVGNCGTSISASRTVSVNAFFEQ